MSTSSPTSLPGYFRLYIEQVKETVLSTAFINQAQLMEDFLASISEEKSQFAYAPGKWTLRVLLQHLIDTERILSYRALCFARREAASLAGFDENAFAAASDGNNRSWASLSTEFIALRQATVFLFESFTPEMMARKGTANNNIFSVNELGFIVVGHFTHHKRIVEERYF